MKLPTLWLTLLAALLIAVGCGSDTAENPATSSTGPGVMNANQTVSCDHVPGTNACGRDCVYLLTNPSHCGRCDNVCTGDQQCVEGTCTTCPSGSQDCGSGCTDLNVDANNCGSCNNSCGGAQCSAGVCECPGGGQLCGGECVARDNPMHCGGCNSPCPELTNCVSGACQCAPGLEACGTGCADLQTDGANCGACGTDCAAQGLFCAAGGCTAECPAGTQACGASCVDINVSLQHCGACDMACAAGTSCQAGSCSCAGGQSLCDGVCADTMTSTSHCGGCGQACAPGQTCNGGTCGCPASGQTPCGETCVDLMTSGLNCGACGTMCGAAETCSAGSCVATMTPVGCPAGQESCNGACVPTGSCTSGGGGGNTGGGPGVVPTPDGCTADPGMIASFEGGSLELLQQEGRIGLVEQFNDGTGTQTTVIETEGADACNQGVLHTSGSGFSEWGAGIGSVFTGTWDDTLSDGEGGYAPSVYDASQYTAISFRAKQGPGQMNPVRFNLSTPSTEGAPFGAGNCADMADVDNPCWNHLGHFLLDDEQLTTQWQTYTFCFDRDLYPMFLPSHVTVDERNTVSQQLLKFQFQFNQSFDPATAMQVAKTGSFDFYIDDIRFTNPASCDGAIFESTGGASDAFGTPGAMGSCMPVPNAGKFSKAITQAYNRWKSKFVAADGGVIDPDEGSRVVSEAIGYGMLITAAMGDKETFDKIYGWAKNHGSPGTLLGWLNGSGGSATDGDTDMAYGLFMAGKQWGGTYAADGATLASAALTGDTVNGLVVGGNQFQSVFNPSYFSPGFYRAFSGWDNVISTTYSTMASCASSFGGLVPDWCSTSGQALSAGATGAQVQAGEICTSDQVCLAFESARTPLRLGYDLCFDSAGQAVMGGFLQKLLDTDSTLADGARIDTIEAGWNASGPLPDGVGNAMAFIGPLGVAGMGLGDAVTRDRAFRATLDIIERPEFYNTYYQSTLGLVSLLTMTGNFPVP